MVSDQALPAIERLEALYAKACSTQEFWDDLLAHLRSFGGRATPLYPADSLTAQARKRLPRGDGARLWLKREDLAHTGSSAINHALGFACVAARADIHRLIAPSAGGAHAAAVAAAAAHLGLKCRIFVPVQELGTSGVATARMLGADVVEVPSGPAGRTESLAAAWDAWIEHSDDSLLVPSAALGPHPLPAMVRDFQSIVGREVKAQSIRLMTKLPDVIVSTVGVGAEAAGVFYPFIDDSGVKLVGVEAGGRSSAPGDHAAVLSLGRAGHILGHTTVALRDESGVPSSVHSVAGGLAYALAGPEHAHWKSLGRVRYTVAGDDEALHAMLLMAPSEGIVPSIEAAHGVSEALRLAGELKADQNIVINLGARGGGDAELASRFIDTSSA